MTHVDKPSAFGRYPWKEEGATMTTTPPTPEDFEAMSAAEFDAYLVRNGMDDRIKAAMREPMTTTPGPLHCYPDCSCRREERPMTGPDHPHDGYAYDGCKCTCCRNVRALAGKAEARADVDGLVALRTYIEEQSLNPNWAKTIGAKFVRNRILDEIDRLLAGDKAEA